jgi:hypothetical protein
MIVDCRRKLANPKKEAKEMKSLAAMISVLMVASTLAAAEPTWSSLEFSLASPNGVAVFGTDSAVGSGSSLVQPGTKSHAGSGYGDWIAAGSGLEYGPASLAEPKQYRPQAAQAPMVTKASGSTLLIIGAAMTVGGVILLAPNEKGLAQVLGGGGLVALGGITIYKGIEVLFSAGRDRQDARSHGGLRVGLRLSF